MANSIALCEYLEGIGGELRAIVCHNLLRNAMDAEPFSQDI
jgi:hypothetical protein